MMFPGTDLFARVPFHAAHTILEKGNSATCIPCFCLLNHNGKKLLRFNGIAILENLMCEQFYQLLEFWDGCAFTMPTPYMVEAFRRSHANSRGQTQ